MTIERFKARRVGQSLLVDFPATGGGGATGPTGPAGSAGTDGATGPTGPAGSSGSPSLFYWMHYT